MSAGCEPLCFDRLELHRGPDVENAFLRSEVVLGRAARGTAAHWAGSLHGLVKDLRTAPEVNLLPASRRIRGVESSSGRAMSVLFRGQVRSLDFCARHILGNADYDVRPAGRETLTDCDVYVTDHPLLDRGLFGVRPALRVHPWVQQRCRLGDDWRETLCVLPRSLRKELGRLLRRQGFTVSVSSDRRLKQSFYAQIYAPYVRHRFGRDAILPAEPAFMRESEAAALLMLHKGGEVSAGCLLQQMGEVLVIGKSALNLAHEISDRSELLDYFSLLLAQKLGCRWLDFGVSRPHLDDGVFRYKAKWRPDLLPAGGFKRTLRIRPLRASDATRGFLSRNGFIERRRGRFLVRQLHERGPAAAAVAELDARAERAGLAAFVYMAEDLAALTVSAGPTQSRVELRPVLPAADPLRSFLTCC